MPITLSTALRTSVCQFLGKRKDSASSWMARLAGRDEAEQWLPKWREALEVCFPNECSILAARLGYGLKELLGDENALEDAYKTTDVGLLSGMSVTPTKLRASGERLLLDVIDPLAEEMLSTR